MKNKKAFFALALGLVLLIAGASVLYDRLSGQVDSPQLSVQDTPGVVSPPADSGPGDDAGSANDSGSADNTGSGEAADDQRTAAPDFTVYDQEGNAVKLSDFRGKPVVLNFWASWCGPCKSEMPGFDDACAAYGSDIHFLMVNLTDGSRETVAVASAYIAQEGYSFPVYYDTEYQAAISYGVSAIPVTYFIDGEGYLAAMGQGALDRATLQTGIDLILPQ